MNGAGIIKGLIETARNFVGSYHDQERLTTVQYPEEKLAPVENARTIPFLVFDGDEAMAGLRCTACMICEKECPPQCIYIVKDAVKKPDFVGKMQMQPKVFDIDISVCMSCGLCVEVCPFDAIKMDQVFELSAQDRFGALLLSKTQLAKPNAYFNKLHKTEAGAIDALREDEKRKAEAAAAAKAAAPKPPAPAPGGAK
jgi:NADH-quinone oxidoreductase subunit I